MSAFFRQIDMLLAHEKMPDEYTNVQSSILCNDCEKRSVAPFHFIYHKCRFCHSYNTKLLHTFTEQIALEPEANLAVSSTSDISEDEFSEE